jgi:thioesterase domain-containing protein/acyl carrier protein
MQRIWADALQKENIGLNEDYFEIGGDSLVAAVMVDQIYRVFGKRVPINTLFEAPTISELAKLIETLEPKPTPIVPIRPSGPKTPIFCFHSLGGSVLGYYSLAKYLPADYPVWAIQPRGTDGTLAPIPSIPEMARYYSDEITRVHSDGEFILTGISLGSEIAFEVARELISRGRTVKKLVLIDPATPLPRPVSTQYKILDSAKKARQSLIYSMAMRRSGRLSPQRARNRIYQNNIRAGSAYRNSAPEPIDVDATLLRAKYRDEYHVSDEGLAEWHRLTGGLESVVEVYGAHSGEDYVLDEPNVEAVATAFLGMITDDPS